MSPKPNKCVKVKKSTCSLHWIKTEDCHPEKMLETVTKADYRELDRERRADSDDMVRRVIQSWAGKQ